MGWLWSSSSDDKRTASESSTKDAASSTAPSSRFALTEEQKLRIFGRPSAPPPTLPTGGDQADDAEINALLKAFEAAEQPNASKNVAVTPTPASPEQVETEATNHDRIRADGSLDISPDRLYPRTMSCRQAFDQAFYCQSLGGKFNDLYRFGTLKDCSEQWGAFWFCMRTRTWSDDSRQKAVMEYYADRDMRKKKEFGSSEDIWKIRHTAVERAFDQDPDADGESETVVR